MLYRKNKESILKIQPVIQFKYQSPILILKKWVAEIIIRVYQEKIAGRLIPPLQAAVDIKIIPLGIVLDKSGPEYFSGKINLHSWCQQQ